MKRRYKIAIVALVALATNFGLHAAFGWGGHHQHYRNHHGGCGHHGYYQEHPGCSNNSTHADPLHCGRENNEAVKDTIAK